MKMFIHGLNAVWSICGRDVMAAFDLSPFVVIYDLGGKFPKNLFQVSSLVSHINSKLSCVQQRTFLGTYW